MIYSLPRLVKDKHYLYSVVFYVQGLRYRVSSGQKFGVDLHPNRAPVDQRLLIAQELQICIHHALHDGWGQDPTSEMTLLQAVEKHSFKDEVKETYRVAFARTQDRLIAYLKSTRIGQMKLYQITSKHCLGFLHSKPITASSFNTERKHLSSLLGVVLKPLGLANPVESIGAMKEIPTLHKPFNDVHAVLEEIKAFNENLFLCCLLTYGCLLRPHQEIRQLKWSDFGDDLTFISLSGRRNKSGRNRLVPISPYIREYLHPGVRTHNIFTSAEEPFNACYFKTLWRRYKKQSKLLEANQTLYSFRHTGAIEVYKKSKDVAVVQQVMGHASMQVTLGYLRNLEVPVLRVEDMPRLCVNFES